MNGIVRVTPEPALLPSQADLATMLTLAEQFVSSGLLPPEIKTASAALLVIQKGRELGIPPAYALSNIAVVKGKPTCSAELMLALIKRDHGRDALHVIETTAERCTVEYRDGSHVGRFSFGIDDAKLAGLAGSPTWRSYPAAMLRARAISAVARMAFPDSIAGMYVPEEMGAAVTVDADGEVRPVSEPATALLEAAQAPTRTDVSPDDNPARAFAERFRARLRASLAKTPPGDTAPAEAVRPLREALTYGVSDSSQETPVSSLSALWLLRWIVSRPDATWSTLSSAEAAALAKWTATESFPSQAEDFLLAIDPPPAYDREHYRRKWHALASGTRYADEEVRHSFVANFSRHRYGGLRDFLNGEPESEAQRLIDQLAGVVTRQAEAAEPAGVAF